MKQIITIIKQKWAEYFLEIIVIVIGVLGAFYLNSWKEYREKEKQEFELLQNLKDDFLKDHELINKGILDLKTDLTFLKTTINNTGPLIVPPERSILDSIETINYTVVELVYGTLGPTLNTSGIGLLKNKKLRVQLLSFPIQLAKYKETEIAARNLALEQRKEHQKYISILNRELYREGRFSDEKNHFSSDYIGWLRDRNYQNLSLDRVWQIDQAIDELEKLNDSNNEILSLIINELERF